MKNTLPISALILTALLACSCSTVKTKPVATGGVITPKHGGVSYYLPKGVVTASVLKSEATDASGKLIASYRLSLSDVAYVPDTTQLFFLRYEPSILADDALTVDVTSKGLLSKVNVSSEDQTGAVVLKLAELGKEVAKGFVLLSAGPGETTVFQQTFDPLDAASVSALNTAIKGYAGNLQLTVNTTAAPAPVVGAEGFSGIAYRPLMPCEVVVSGNDSQTEAVIYVPNKAIINTFPLDRGAFIKKVANLTFDNGVLTEFTINKPSEALGAVSLPVDLAKLVASVPAEILTVKVNHANDEKSLLQAQQALLDAQKSLQQAQKK